MPNGKVPEHVKRALRGDVEEPQLAELASHFFQMAGGTRAVAKMLLDEYHNAKAGSVIRQRILDMLLRVTRFANEKAGVRDRLDLLSDDDLDREFETSVRHYPGVADEAEPQRRTEAPEVPQAGRTGGPSG